MRGRRLFLVPLLLLAAGFAPAPFPRKQRNDPAKDEVGKMQGSWVVVQFVVGGRDLVSLLPPSLLRIEFAGSRMTTLLKGGLPTTWHVELSPASAPKGLTKTEDGDRTVARCIYRF